MKIFLLLLLFCFLPFQLQAQELDFSEFYEVDLDAPVPDLKVLEAEVNSLTEVYEPRYLLSWKMGDFFDKVWAGIIKSYGTSEIRIKDSFEDELLEMLSLMPKEYYPYIGPLLHASPGISEKILNLPGIKETKNKFPQRIAPQLAGIEDLEFLSPHLYILLMPEMWPDNQKSLEKPRLKNAKIPQTPYNPLFYDEVMQSVPEGGFGSAYNSQNILLKDKLRTLNITKTSPLTSQDVKAFVATLDGVKAFSTLNNVLLVARAGNLLNYWEQKNGTALPVNALKDGVNPCQRLALKIKWAGLETEFLKSISKEGFNLKEWAYTCDKTIKAYRIANISGAKLAGISAYKKGLYNSRLNNLTDKWKQREFATLESLVKMYKAPRSDVLEALKNEAEIKEKINEFGGIMVTSPIAY